MSETALTLITDALFEIGVLAEGETASDAMVQHALRRLKYMFRQWSAKNIRLYYSKQDTLTLTGAASYTIGSGGDCNTVRPASIRGARTTKNIVKIIDEDHYRALILQDISSDVEYLWYNPEFPLGKLYPYPAGSGTLYLDSLKPLDEPANMTSDIEFPPEYDQAIVCGLAVRLAPSYGRAAQQETVAVALDSLKDLENKNFAEQINAVPIEIIKFSQRYNINHG